VQVRPGKENFETLAMGDFASKPNVVYRIPALNNKNSKEFINGLDHLTHFACFLCMTDHVHDARQPRNDETPLRWRERAAFVRKAREETPNNELKRLLDKLAEAFEALSNQPR
jgi:hypothetical protein